MHECPKCQGRMSEGFSIDKGYGTVDVTSWQEGKPQKSFWTWIKQSKDRHEITTWRCDRCGYLESYAA
jgi:hypothetical protein